MGKINKEKQVAAPQKLLLELFEYNELNGGFVWIKKPSNHANIKVGQNAGCLDKKSGYVNIQINGYRYLAHRLAWTYIHGDYPDGEQPFIDHINGVPSDNRIVNLRVSSLEDNNRNVQMNSRNKSGVTGVFRKSINNNSKKNPKINHYWVANWFNENGKQRQRYFNIEKLGEEVAKQLATKYRAEQIRLLEINHNIIYSERHGR